MPPAQNGITGLVLLSSVNTPGIEELLREVLAPFTLEIVEVQRITLRGRLILGMLISFDPAHGDAISNDIDEFSQKTGIDVALDYSDNTNPK